MRNWLNFFFLWLPTGFMLVVSFPCSYMKIFHKGTKSFQYISGYLDRKWLINMCIHCLHSNATLELHSKSLPSMSILILVFFFFFLRRVSKYPSHLVQRGRTKLYDCLIASSCWQRDLHAQKKKFIINLCPASFVARFCTCEVQWPLINGTSYSRKQESKVFPELLR